MKKITLILLFPFFMASICIKAQTNLSAGDIAFTHFDRDNDDSFSFICLVQINVGTDIYFTDNGWNGSSLGTTEGIIRFTTNDTHIAGTQIIINRTDKNATVYGGSATGSYTSISGSFNLADGGDSILAYQSSTPKTPMVTAFIAGINSDDDNLQANGWHLGSNTSSLTSALPSSLTNGVNALSLFIAGSPLNNATPEGPTGEKENNRYKASALHAGNAADLLTALMNLNNWETNDDVAYTQPSATFTSVLSVHASTFEDDLSVYPNPSSSGNFTLRNSGAALQSVSVADINGRTVYNAGLNGITTDQTLDLNLSSGMYFVNIQSQQASTVKKLIVK